MINSIWQGYGHMMELKTSGSENQFAVHIDGRVTVFDGTTHSCPEYAAKAFFFGVMEDFKKEAQDVGETEK